MFVKTIPWPTCAPAIQTKGVGHQVAFRLESGTHVVQMVIEQRTPGWPDSGFRGPFGSACKDPFQAT